MGKGKMNTQKKLEKLKKKSERQGLNISDDALFVVSELHELRNLMLWLFGIMIGLTIAIIGLIVGFGVAILSPL